MQSKSLVSGSPPQQEIADIGFNMERLSHLKDVIVRQDSLILISTGRVNIQIPIGRNYANVNR
jgi:hypothetical protein